MALTDQIKNCKVCDKEYSPKKGVSYLQWSKSNWCSKKCFNISITGRKLSQEHKNKIGIKSKGHIVSQEVRDKIALANTGKVRTKKMLDNLSLAHLGQVAWNKGKKYLQISGEKHPMWKGGVSKNYKTGYYSLEYKQWRKSVFERDNYTCQDCGITNVYLTAHHIKSFTHYPELRFELSNGQTLCEECHKQTDNYKGGAVRLLKESYVN